MRRIITNFLFLVIGVLIGLNLFNPCDVNRDGKVTSVDYVIVKNYILKRG